MAAMLAVFRPGSRVPVIQGVSPAIMVLTVAGVMLVTTELSQATLVLTMEAMEAALSSGSRALRKVMVAGSLAMPATAAVSRPGSRVPVTQVSTLLRMVFTVATSICMVKSEIQPPLLLTMSARATSSSRGSRSEMKSTVAGSLAMAATVPRLRPPIRVAIQPLA